jgi:hypothetical protein
MAKPEGITKKTKDNSHKKPYEREQWQKGKRIGRPKQRWVEATLYGVPFTEDMTPADIEREITEHSIEHYVAAHWERTK